MKICEEKTAKAYYYDVCSISMGYFQIADQGLGLRKAIDEDDATRQGSDILPATRFC